MLLPWQHQAVAWSFCQTIGWVAMKFGLVCRLVSLPTILVQTEIYRNNY